MDRSMDSRGIVSVFGSAAPLPSSPEYQQARKLGDALAQRGWTVATGGYGGTMEAVSRGAAEAGGTVIGVTADQIESYRPEPPNRWVTREIRYATGRERLFHLVFHNEAIIALPGGIGTLTEWALAWNLLQTGELSPRPFFVVGEAWSMQVEALLRSPWVPARENRRCRAMLDVESVWLQLGRPTRSALEGD